MAMVLDWSNGRREDAGVMMMVRDIDSGFHYHGGMS